MKGYIPQHILGHPARLAFTRYTGALLAVAVGVLLALWLQPLLDASVVLLVAILVAAWFSGFWPALLASLLATLALDYFFTPPLYTLTTEIAHIPRLLVFTLFSAMFVGISAARRRAERLLMQARDNLDATVRERTADLTRANQSLSTQYAVTRKLADSDSLDAALPEVLQIIGTAMNWDWGALWKVDRDAQVLRCSTLWRTPGVSAEGRADDRHLAFGLGRGLPGQVWQSGEARWIADVAQEPGFLRAESVAAAGLHAATAFPILIGDETIGVLELFSRAVRGPNPGELETLSALGSQIGQLVERRRAEGEREQTLVREQAAHAEAAASQQRFRELVDSIEGIVWEADARTFQLTFVSKQAERILGYPVTQWLDQATFWKDHLHADDRESAVNLSVNATAQKRDHDFEYRMLASDGRVVWLRALVTVVVENDQVTRLRGVTLDITARKQAEQALREQANLLNLTHDTIFVRDMNDVIRYWNRGAEELYGWKSGEAMGLVTHELMHTIFPAPLEQITSELVQEGRWEGELVHTKRDGSKVVVASRWSLLRDLDGRPIAILETNNDITERKQAENKLRRSEASLAEAQRLCHTGSWVRNVVDGTFTASPEWLRIAGYQDEPVWEMLSERVHPDDRDRIYNDLARGLDEKRDFEVEHRIVLPDGSIRHVHSRGHPVINDSGQVVEIVGALVDVTERKRAEDALRASEEQWRDVFENNPTMYFMVDEAGTVLAVNPFGAEMLGYRVEELVGEPVLGVFPESEREAVQGNVAACLAELGRAHSWEARKVRKNGTGLWARDTAKAVARANGPIVLIACEDITEQKGAAEALRQAQADLAHVNRVTTMGELTASLAHEVNQPIAAALTNAKTCLLWLGRDTPNIEEARAAARRIVQDGTRAADIISRIRLLFTKGAPQLESVDVNEVIRETIILLRGEATRYAISVRTELAPDLPQVMGDRVQLQQVMMNLIMNSIDAMKDADGTRELAITSQPAQNEHLLVSVSDTGVGLPPQQADQIFNAFFTTKRQGTGMGLSISRSIIESHGGRLWAMSNDGPGSTFHFTLSHL